MAETAHTARARSVTLDEQRVYFNGTVGVRYHWMLGLRGSHIR